MEDDGGGCGGEDPFDSFLSLCHVSSSQEERLRRCAFAPEPYNPENADESSEEESGGGGIPMASTPIRLVSPPESEEEENEFHTPPEEAAMSSSSELRPAVDLDGREEGVVDRRSVGEFDGGGETAFAVVDLSRDSELGFSEVEAAQRENPDSEAVRLSSEVFDAELRGNRDLTREVSLDSGLGESPLKKLKISEQNSEERNEESEIVRGASNDYGFDFHGKRSSAKRKLELGDDENSAEIFPLDSEAQANNGVSEMRNSENNGVVEPDGDGQPSNVRERISPKEFLEAMDVLRHDSAGETQETRDVELRRLPCSIIGQSENVAAAAVAEDDENHREVTIVDVLKLLTEDRRDDDILSCSFLDIAKRRGMQFSRPAWWPEKGTGFGNEDVEVESF